MIQLKFSRSNTTTYPRSQSNSPQHQFRLEACPSNHDNDSIWVQQNKLPIGLSYSNHANTLIQNVFENFFYHQWAFEDDSVFVDYYFHLVFCLFAVRYHHHRESLHPSSHTKHDELSHHEKKNFSSDEMRNIWSAKTIFATLRCFCPREVVYLCSRVGNVCSSV